MRSTLERAHLIFAVGLLCILVIAGCKKPTEQIASGDPVHAASVASESIPNLPAPTQIQQQDCSSAAKNALGSQAKVLRCGTFNSPDVQEVIAVLPANFPTKDGSGIAIRKMMILRKEPMGWRVAVTAAREIQNEAGYVGIDYIDDYFHYYGYWLTFSDAHSNDVGLMIIDLLDIEKGDGSSEAASTEIAWNPKVGRYQEWHPDGFQPEVKNPPHWKAGVKLPATHPK
jgi:hypothetical protein